MHIKVVKKTDKAFRITFPDTVTITGWLFYFTAKKKVTIPDDDAVISFEWSEHTGPQETVLSLPREMTDIEPGDYYYDILIKDDSGKVKPLKFGADDPPYPMKVTKTVTDRRPE